jgi:hypothetical protein
MVLRDIRALIGFQPKLALSKEIITSLEIIIRFYLVVLNECRNINDIDIYNEKKLKDVLC